MPDLSPAALRLGVVAVLFGVVLGWVLPAMAPAVVVPMSAKLWAPLICLVLALLTAAWLRAEARPGDDRNDPLGLPWSAGRFGRRTLTGSAEVLGSPTSWRSRDRRPDVHSEVGRRFSGQRLTCLPRRFEDT